ncbi:MAG: hypothetical protein AAFR23_04605, partial [Pseudomonadota bacterium]
MSTLTHMIAALIGGAVVLLFGEQLAGQMGVPLPKRVAEVPAEFTSRLAALEQSSKAAEPAELPADETKLISHVC